MLRRPWLEYEEDFEELGERIQILLWLMLALAIAGCATPLPAGQPGTPMASPESNVFQPQVIRKLGPELRRHLLQRGQEVLRQAQDGTLEAPGPFDQQLRPVTVVIRARWDITEELESRGVKIRSTTHNEIVVITADVPLGVIPDLLTLPALETMELAQPNSPAQDSRDEP